MSSVPETLPESLGKKHVYERIERVDYWPAGVPRSESTSEEYREVHEGRTAYEAFRAHLRGLAESDLNGVTRIAVCHDGGYKISVDRNRGGSMQYNDTWYVEKT
ncbi:hypothetical protein [Glutamicibacter creatinolyticus]|uniref:hypothetical protein n=1 Tax=Glutamicibacter creatinolyticus TaxID=162496 RepID=UPI0031DA4579